MDAPPDPGGNVPFEAYLLVKLRPNLAAHLTTFKATFAGINLLPGVEQVVDLGECSPVGISSLQKLLEL